MPVVNPPSYSANMVDQDSHIEPADDDATGSLQPPDSQSMDPADELDPADDFDSAELDPADEFDADDEISLDALAAAYAGLVGGGEGAPAKAPSTPADESSQTSKPEPLDESNVDEQVSPLGILEAVLFVGNAENTPLTSKRIAALMRGVSPREIDELVAELNARYREFESPYEIVSHGAGYLLSIRDEYAGLRDRFYGSVREARLSQAAIDILAVIAYGQPLTREEIDETRGKPSGGILSQLVRRQLLRIERPETKPRDPKYYTTERFLKIMGLEDIQELPESHEFDKTF